MSGIEQIETRAFSAKMEEIQKASQFVTQWLDQFRPSIDEDVLYDLRLAVTELFANIVEHSYESAGEEVLSVTLTLRGDELRIKFIDHGRRPKLQTLRGRRLNEFRERGLGLFLITRCVDSLVYRFCRNGSNHTTISRRLEERPPHREIQEHKPFYTVLYEIDDSMILVALVGYLHKIELSPIGFLLPFTEVIFESSMLESTTSEGIEKLTELVNDLKGRGKDVYFYNPPAHFTKAVSENTTLAVIPEKEHWIGLDDPTNILVDPHLPGRYLPLLRRRPQNGKQIPIDQQGSPELGRFLTGGFENKFPEFSIKCRISPGAWPSGTFARIEADPAAQAGICFVGSAQHFGLKAIAESLELYGLLASFPVFVEKVSDDEISIKEFLYHLSELIRDMQPRAEADAYLVSPLIMPVVIHDDRIVFWTGSGPVLARSHHSSFRGIMLGLSELGLIQPRTVRKDDFLTGPTGTPQLRMVLGRKCLWEPPGGTFDREFEDGNSGIYDKGILDVHFGVS